MEWVGFGVVYILGRVLYAVAMAFRLSGGIIPDSDGFSPASASR